jgi:hypothetical protein
MTFAGRVPSVAVLAVVDIGCRVFAFGFDHTHGRYQSCISFGGVAFLEADELIGTEIPAYDPTIKQNFGYAKPVVQGFNFLTAKVWVTIFAVGGNGEVTAELVC